MLRSRLTNLSVALGFLAVLASCGGPDSISPPDDEATLAISINLSGTMVATVVAEVTAPDIPTMLVFNIPINGGSATGTITVPAGSNRLITLRAYDGGGVKTHTGSTTVNIQSGTNTTISIVLTPLTGDVPIIATLGSFVVTVTPPSANLAVHGTTQLTATIKDSDGNTVTSGVVAWATRDPGIATVSTSGVVTANGVGNTTISAVFQGVTGTTAITVGP